MEHVQNISIDIALGLSLIAMIVAEKAWRLAHRLQWRFDRSQEP